jgi:hypothetical protein
MMGQDCRGPATGAAVIQQYAAVVPTAKVVVSEVATGLGFDRETYESQMDAVMVERVANVLFAADLPVRCASADTFDRYSADNPTEEVVRVGAMTADAVCWHHAGVEGVILAAGYHDAEDAAAEVVRRAAFNRCYRPLIEQEREDR